MLCQLWTGPSAAGIGAWGRVVAAELTDAERPITPKPTEPVNASIPMTERAVRPFFSTRKNK
jgi:hypothetical protein